MHGPAVGGQAHDGLAASHRRHRVAGAERLGDHRQVGRDAGEALGPARPDPESGEHLVEDQERPGVGRDRAHPLEVARGGHDRPAVSEDRLGDDRRDALAVVGERRLEPVEVVPAKHDQALAGPGRHAGRLGRHRGMVGRAPRLGRRVRRPVDRVRPAVIVALEAHDQVAAGERPGEAERVLGALGPGASEAHEVDAGHPLAHRPGRPGLEVVGEREERPALAQHVDHGVGDRRRPVAEDQRALSHHVVDVVVAVDVGQDRARPALARRPARGASPSGASACRSRRRRRGGGPRARTARPTGWSCSSRSSVCLQRFGWSPGADLRARARRPGRRARARRPAKHRREAPRSRGDQRVARAQRVDDAGPAGAGCR